MNKPTIHSLVTFLLLSLICSCGLRNAADSVYINGQVYTGNESQPWVDAIAIKDGKFSMIDSDDKIMTVVDKKTRIIDLKGKILLPGIVNQISSNWKEKNAPIQEGQNADFSIIDHKLIATSAEELSKIKILQKFSSGKELK